MIYLIGGILLFNLLVTVTILLLINKYNDKLSMLFHFITDLKADKLKKLNKNDGTVIWMTKNEVIDNGTE